MDNLHRVIDSEKHMYQNKVSQWICHCMWLCVTIVHTTEGLTSLFIDTHPSSATILGRPSTVFITWGPSLYATSGHDKPYNSQSIGWVATWAATQWHSNYVWLYCNMTSRLSGHSSNHPKDLADGVQQVSMDMWSLYTVVFLSALLPGKSCESI